MRAYLFAIIGLMLFLSACVQNQPPATAPVITEPVVQPPSSAPPTSLDSCSSGSILEQDSCYLSLSKQQGKVSWCDKIYSSDKKDQCIFEFAKADGTLCTKLFSSDMRSDCFLSYARAKSDLSICDRIGVDEVKTRCVRELSPPCTFEETDESRAQCMALVKSDYSLCKSTSCFVQFAKNKSDAGACDLIPDSDLATKLSCRAAARKSVYECDASSNSIIQDLCYYLYAQLGGNSSSCARASDMSKYGNACWQYFALKERNSSYCTYVTPEPDRDECYSNYSVTFDDYGTCEKVAVSSNRAGCYLSVGRINGNIVACNFLKFGVGDSCARIVLEGPGVKDPLTCADVSSDLWRDKCFIWSAEHYKNKTLCGFVTSGSTSQCMAPFKYS